MRHVSITFIPLPLACVATASAAPTAEASPAPPAAWTLMVFMNGDNNLEGFALRDFREMARIGSNGDVNIVVQLDRIGKYARPTEDEPVWTDTKRFVIRRDMKPVASAAVASLGEVNMGDPAALESFVAWARREYPADRYALVIWDHGKGYRALDQPVSELSLPFRSATSAPHRSISDDDTDRDHLYNAEVVSALERSLNGARLQILGFDACLMAMLETAYAMRHTAELMVGSEDLEPGNGWKYDDLLRRLQASPRADTREIARLLVQSYADEYTHGAFGADPNVTQSAVDLAQIDSLASAVSRLADRLSAGLGAHGATILRARRACQEYAPGADRNEPTKILFHHVDLGRFASQLTSGVPDAGIVNAANEVLARLQDTVIETFAGAARQGAFGSTGLAIYFPLDRESYRHDKFEEGGYQKSNTHFPVAFVHDHSWADYLHRHFDRFRSVPRD